MSPAFVSNLAYTPEHFAAMCRSTLADIRRASEAGKLVFDADGQVDLWETPNWRFFTRAVGFN